MKCQKCGKPVVIKNGEKIRSCEHKDAPVVVECSAKLRGVARVR